MTKKTNTTPIPKKPTKNRTKNEDLKVSPWLEDYLDLFSFKMKPITEAFISRLSEELNQWSQLDDSLILKRFYTDKNIPREAFYRWANKFPELGASLAQAKERISARREHGGMTRKFDPGFILNYMPMYDDEWKEFIKWKASIKQQEENQQKVVIEISDLSVKSEVSNERRSTKENN